MIKADFLYIGMIIIQQKKYYFQYKISGSLFEIDIWDFLNIIPGTIRLYPNPILSTL